MDEGRDARGRHHAGPCVLFTLASIAVAGNTIATAAAPALIAWDPRLLLLFDARNRHLALAAGAGVGMVPFYVLGIARALVFDPVFFALGRGHGDAAAEWLAKRSSQSARVLELARSLFRRAGALMLLLSPNYAVCLAAGLSPMRWRRFLVVDAISTSIQVWAVWMLGSRFRGPLSTVVEVVERYAVPLTIVSAVAVVVAAGRNRRSRSAAAPGTA